MNVTRCDILLTLDRGCKAQTIILSLRTYVKTYGSTDGLFCSDDSRLAIHGLGVLSGTFCSVCRGGGVWGSGSSATVGGGDTCSVDSDGRGEVRRAAKLQMR